MHLIQERDRLPGRRIAVVIVASVGVVLLTIAAAGGLLAMREAELGPTPMPPQVVPPVVSFVHTGPVRRTRDAARLRAQKEGVLRGFRWVDREAGLVSIPIDDAMRLVAEEGP